MKEKLEILNNYMGISLKASDFSEFWGKNIQRVKESKFEYTVKLSEIQVEGVECYDFYFVGEDGAKIYCKYARPSITGKYPTIFKYHGYYNDSGDWFDKIAWAKLGYNIFAMDCRGQGGKSEDNLLTKGSTLTGHIMKGIEEGPENLAYKKIFLDTVFLVEIAKTFSNVDVNKMYTFGYSQGGALSIACAALNPEIKKVFAIYPFLSDFRRVMLEPEKMEAYGEINRYFRYSDRLHKNEELFFNTLSYIDIQNFANNMKCELVMFTGLQDVLCSVESQYAFYNKFAGKKKVIVYPDFGHEDLPRVHDILLREL